MKFKSLLVSCVLCLAAASASAEPRAWPGAHPAPTQAEPNPALLLSQGMNEMVQFLRRQPAPSSAELMAYIDAEVAPAFDFSYMTQWVAGNRYRYMSEAQRSAMQGQLQQLFLGALAKRLGNYSNQQVRYSKPRRVSNTEVNVAVDILTPGSYPARLNFRFYRGEQGWRIFDVAANGSSALVHYRQHFARLQRQSPRWG